MASAFKPPIRIIAHRRDNAAVYTFDSANKAAAFTHTQLLDPLLLPHRRTASLLLAAVHLVLLAGYS